MTHESNAPSQGVRRIVALSVQAGIGAGMAHSAAVSVCEAADAPAPQRGVSGWTGPALMEAASPAVEATRRDRTVSQQAESDWRELAQRAVDLAAFIVGDRAVALDVAAQALARLRVAAVAQNSRLQYQPKRRPRARGEGPRAGRTRVLATDAHLLQRLVYAASDPYERRRERSGCANGSAMVVHFVKHLVRICLRRNSLYVALGVNRLLHNYSTAETQQMYAVVTQDPGLVPDDSYWRSRKRQLMQELSERFGALLSVVTGPRGEQRFETDPDARHLGALVEDCLARFALWDTPCSVPDAFDPWSAELPALYFEGHRPDAWHHIETNRIHAVLHPACYRRLLRALSLDPPESRLDIPRFVGAPAADPPSGPTDHTTGPLREHEWLWIEDRLEEGKPRRGWKRVLSVAVDGQEQARLDLLRGGRVTVFAHGGAECVEVRDSAGALLALLPLGPGGIRAGAAVSLELPDGRRFRFRAIGILSGDGLGVEVTCDDAHPLRAAAVAAARYVLAALERLSRPCPAGGLSMLGRGALAVLVLAITLVGPSSRLPQDVLRRPRTLTDTPSSGAGASQSAASATVPYPPARIARSEALATDETTRELPRGPRPQRLAEVRSVFVDRIGTEPAGASLQVALEASLSSRMLLAPAASVATADAALQGTLEGHGAHRRLTLFLVDSDGNVLWESTRPAPEAASDAETGRLAHRAVEELLSAVRTARR
jgi:hypothetical protein